MIGEFSFYGIYFPWLLVEGLCALALGWCVRRVLARAGFYRLVWHPPLFDVALFVVLLFGVSQVSPFILQR
ncbi:DUF1656 domain-containing protein [Bordetella sp. 2513F-2]